MCVWGGGGYLYVLCMWLVCVNICIVSGTVKYYVVSQCTNVHEFQYLEERIFNFTPHSDIIMCKN